MLIKVEDYAGKKFIFNCKKCKKKKEFNFKHFNKLRGAILMCCTCGHLISKHINFLNKQLEEKKK